MPASSPSTPEFSGLRTIRYLDHMPCCSSTLRGPPSVLPSQRGSKGHVCIVVERSRSITWNFSSTSLTSRLWKIARKCFRGPHASHLQRGVGVPKSCCACPSLPLSLLARSHFQRGQVCCGAIACVRFVFASAWLSKAVCGRPRARVGAPLFVACEHLGFPCRLPSSVQV